MSILITSDIQCEWNNLDLCEQAWNECLDICKERHIKTIAYLGDGKQSYNPVDIRVVRWWQDAIRQAIKRNISVLYNLGNHDRVGQYTDADNWLPILRRAGAETFDTPGIKDLEWCRLFVLPFSRNDVAKRNIQRFLKEKPDREKDILLFHHDLKGILYNKQGSVSDASLNISDIFSNKFRYCIGGHIHNPQKFHKNVFYVGSPFCHDWGEVNQRKRYLVVGKNGIESIPSKISGWYSLDVDGFDKATNDIKSWTGTKIRISVSCDASEDYGSRLEKARRKAEHKFRGATIYVVPRFKDRRQKELGISASDSDERKVREYIKQTTSVERVGRSLALKYMLDKLSKFSGGLRTSTKTEFLSAKGINFLPFKHVTTDFNEKGITVIQGINEDRNGKSNGAAKTSLVQLLPVSMFGKTFKDQKSDSWANRWTKESATAEVTLLDHKGREIDIIRGRRPPMLKMMINGKDHSSGMKSNDKEGTQTQIEQVTGFTWQTLANAVYIDRRISDAFLSGTRKERTEVLSRFQNLERFQRALDLVKKDEKKNRDSIQSCKETLSATRASIMESEESLNNLKSLSKVQLDGAYKEFFKCKKALKRFTSKDNTKGLEAIAKRVKKAYDKRVNHLRDEEKHNAIIKSEIERYEVEGIRWHKLRKKGKCLECEQSVSSKWLKLKAHRIYKAHKALQHQLDDSNYVLSKLRRKVQLLDGEYTKIQHQLGKYDNERKLLEGAKRTAQSQLMDLSGDKHTSKIIINKVKAKLKSYIADKKYLKKKLDKYDSLSKLYEYASEAFSRDGIPAFLNRQLCPILNKAADYYANLFSDREIQLQFSVDKGEFVPIIINPKGGETIEDQSTGERALAGLIASFALREVAPKCNVLILDEPGEGLDQQTAKQFARALQELKHRFGSIWITTHNVHILSELSGERILTVRKKNKISKVVEG